jgi:hypothetical protein
LPIEGEKLKRLLRLHEHQSLAQNLAPDLNVPLDSTFLSVVPIVTNFTLIPCFSPLNILSPLKTYSKSGEGVYAVPAIPETGINPLSAAQLVYGPSCISLGTALGVRGNITEDFDTPAVREITQELVFAAPGRTDLF